MNLSIAECPLRQTHETKEQRDSDGVHGHGYNNKYKKQAASHDSPERHASVERPKPDSNEQGCRRSDTPSRNPDRQVDGPEPLGRGVSGQLVSFDDSSRLLHPSILPVLPACNKDHLQ